MRDVLLLKPLFLDNAPLSISSGETKDDSY